jgi:hypothetical protein
MKRLAARLFGFIGPRQLRVGAKVIAESKEPLNIWRAYLKAVQLCFATGSLRIVESEVAAALKTVFAPAIIAKPFEDRTGNIQIGKVAHDWHQIENWLGANVWNGSRTDVMHENDQVTNGGRDTMGFPLRIVGPSRIMRPQFDRDNPR